MKSKSIGMKLRRVRTYETQERVLSEWVDNWEDDQLEVIKKLRAAATRDDHSEIMHMIQQLEGLSVKRLGSLRNVMKTVSDPERQLKKMEDVESRQEEED
jgi:hypothetical protein